MKISQIYRLFQQYPVICTDTRKISKNSLFFALKGEVFNGNKFAAESLRNGAAFAIVDEKKFCTSAQTILVKDSLQCLQQLASYHRKQWNIPIIALTGSNGKTTTKELINAVLSTKYTTVATTGNLNNHIGVPLTLLKISEQTDIAIIEMGANHPKEIQFLSSIAQPTHGYITNFGKAHLEGFGSLEGVVKAKSELYDYLKDHQGYIFYNQEDTKQKEMLRSYKHSISFGNQYSDICILLKNANPTVKITYKNTLINSNLTGDYNFSNIRAAIGIGAYFKVPLKKIEEGIRSYIPSNNRSQIINKNGHKIILDAYNANPSSMDAALKNFSTQKHPHKVVILGDMLELGAIAQEEHQKTVCQAEKFQFQQIFLLGPYFANTNKSYASCFIAFKYLAEAIKNKIKPHSLILVKGSRGMKLERILDYL